MGQRSSFVIRMGSFLERVIQGRFDDIDEPLTIAKKKKTVDIYFHNDDDDYDDDNTEMDRIGAD
ncbi:hypothetical protein E4U30_008393 [Claviceps sp. LM220 group G6]|nr:hypothetical protein E4U30_008393 [Claviceps sp. LM220 group G6]